MRYQDLDLNLLGALQAILKEKSVTRAGEVINMSQSGMSSCLARLREYLGDPLVIQTGNQPQLTPRGQALVEPVNDILRRIDATLATRPVFNPHLSRRHFSVVASDYAISVLLLDLLRQIHAEAPAITLEFSSPNLKTAAELEGGEVDLIIVAEKEKLPEQCSVSLFSDSYSVVVDAAMGTLQQTVNIDQYLSMRHVAVGNDRIGLPEMEAWLANKYGETRRVAVLAPSFYLLAPLVIGTTRIATMQTRLARLLAAEFPIRLVQPLFDLPPLCLILQWRKHRSLDPGIQWLRERIVRQAAKAGPRQEWRR
jgi:LysR family transcriptional regulator, nod-box dependent transcriptional activator